MEGGPPAFTTIIQQHPSERYWVSRKLTLAIDTLHVLLLSYYVRKLTIATQKLFAEMMRIRFGTLIRSNHASRLIRE